MPDSLLPAITLHALRGCLCGSKVLGSILCADVGAPRQHRRTFIEMYRSAEGEKRPPRNLWYFRTFAYPGSFALWLGMFCA